VFADPVSDPVNHDLPGAASDEQNRAVADNSSSDMLGPLSPVMIHFPQGQEEAIMLVKIKMPLCRTRAVGFKTHGSFLLPFSIVQKSFRFFGFSGFFGSSSIRPCN
jgi:hypothetical protein